MLEYSPGPQLPLLQLLVLVLVAVALLEDEGWMKGLAGVVIVWFIGASS
jgi:hypothetical protein